MEQQIYEAMGERDKPISDASHEAQIPSFKGVFR